MPKQKKTSKLTQSEQAKRFKEAAEKAGVTKDEAELEKAFKSVVVPREKPRSAP